MNRDPHRKPPDRPYEVRFPIRFFNNSDPDGDEEDTTIPPYGLMQVDVTEGAKTDDETVIKVIRPDDDGKNYFVNGPLAVRAGKWGRCCRDGVMRVAFETNAEHPDPPEPGVVIGPGGTDDETWRASEGHGGYKVLGAAEYLEEGGTTGDPGVVLCVPDVGAAAGALLRANEDIDGRVSTTPGTSSDYEVIYGTCAGDVENWSTVLIDDGAYMVIITIDGHNVIYDAFC